MTDITPEMLDRMEADRQMLALVISPAVLREVVGKPLPSNVTIDKAYTFGDTVYDGVQDRDLLVVSLSMTRHNDVG